jgi:uncharacterized repeat protein (TIGR01451 family)
MHYPLTRSAVAWRAAIVAAAACCALAAGCRGIPRIDPTGQRCFIWPDQAATNTPLVVPGNVQAAPVTTTPVFPASPAIAAPATVAPGVVPVAAAMPATPQDKLTITPERVLAPVGSEVVLKASICTTEGYTLADQKIEWMLGRNGVGQFVELGGKGCIHPPLLPWNKGSKVDNYLAQGYTATAPLCIDRGTADPTDDVNINRGDAWISVTSPNEGTSHVTAYTPAVESWDYRRTSAVIYWVDVQWTFPAAAITSSGRPELLTTTVVRQTDATPLTGWIVRYAVADAPEQTREVLTGADGRATVEIAPTATGAPSSRVDVELIRPAGFNGGDAPRLVVARGTSIVSWGSGNYLPGGTTTTIPATPLPTTPPFSSPSAPITPSTPIPTQPPTTPPAAGPARLELNVTNPPQVEVGRVAPLKINVRNSGQSPATGITLTVEFPAELSSNNDTRGTRRIAWPIEGQSLTLGPGEQRELDVPLNVLRAGRLCPTVSAVYKEGSPQTRQACFNAVDPQNQPQGRVNLKMTGPAKMTVGETAAFSLVVQNTGDLPLVNITVTEDYPTMHFQATPTEPNVQPVSGVITRFIPRLEVGTSKEFRVNCRAIAATATARPFATVEAQTDPPGAKVTKGAEVMLAIVPPTGVASPGGTPLPGAAGANLSVRVNFPQPTIQARTRATCEVVVTNLAAAADRNVAVRVSFPPELKPDLAAIETPPNVQARLDGNNVIFTPLPTLASQDRARFLIPVNAIGSGVNVKVLAGATSAGSPEVVEGSANLEILGNSA